MVSAAQAFTALNGLSNNVVAFVRRSDGVILPGSGRIRELSEQGFSVASVNGVVAFGVHLDIEGLSFDITAPIFCLSSDERKTVPKSALLVPGLLIDAPGDNKLFLMELPQG